MAYADLERANLEDAGSGAGLIWARGSHGSLREGEEGLKMARRDSYCRDVLSSTIEVEMLWEHEAAAQRRDSRGGHSQRARVVDLGPHGAGWGASILDGASRSGSRPEAWAGRTRILRADERRGSRRHASYALARERARHSLISYHGCQQNHRSAASGGKAADRRLKIRAGLSVPLGWSGALHLRRASG